MSAEALYPDRLLNIREVAALLGIGVRTARRMTRSGLIPAPVRLGRLCRWRYSELTDWLRALPSTREPHPPGVSQPRGCGQSGEKPRRKKTIPSR